MTWLYLETKNVDAVAQLFKDIFWLVITSLVLFIALPAFLAKELTFMYHYQRQHC